MLMEINPNAEDIVSKCSWVVKSYLSIESKMLCTCGGIASIMNYYHSGIVSYERCCYYQSPVAEVPSSKSANLVINLLPLPMLLLVCKSLPHHHK
jgi:hypothetical protein